MGVRTAAAQAQQLKKILLYELSLDFPQEILEKWIFMWQQRWEFNFSYHGKSHISLFECWSIIGPITSDSNHLALVPNSAINYTFKETNVG